MDLGNGYWEVFSPLIATLKCSIQGVYNEDFYADSCCIAYFIPWNRQYIYCCIFFLSFTLDNFERKIQAFHFQRYSSCRNQVLLVNVQNCYNLFSLKYFEILSTSFFQKGVPLRVAILIRCCPLKTRWKIGPKPRRLKMPIRP